MTNKVMKTVITIVVSGKKSGELIYFKLEMDKSNFFQVIEMDFESVEDVLQAEKNGMFKII